MLHRTPKPPALDLPRRARLAAPAWPTALANLTALAALAALVGCGGPKPRPAAPPPNVAAGVAAAVAAADAQPTASASFAVFSAAAPPGDADQAAKALLAKVQAGFRGPPEDLRPLLSGRFAPEDLVVRPVPVAELPLALAVLVEAAGPHGPAVAAARTAVLVRASGAPDGDGTLLRRTALAAALAAGPEDVVVDLSTWRAVPRGGVAAELARPDWLADQVVPVVAQGEDGALMFHTRGLGRFGLPDLQTTGVPVADGRAAFEWFQGEVNALRTAGAGSALARTLGAGSPCAVLTGAVDGDCRRLARPAGKAD